MSDNKNNSTLTKITPPRSAHCLPRERLFAELDRALQHKAVWIHAPAGSGKTLLASSYLHSRQWPVLWYQLDEGDGDIASFFYYMGLAAEQLLPGSHSPLPVLSAEYRGEIQTFARNYFRELFRRIPGPAGIVLDNYQEVADSSVLHDVLLCAVAELPPGLGMMILSRQEPPPQFARLCAHGDVTELGWEQLRLSLDESRDLADLYSDQPVDTETLEKIYAQTQGWAVGLILLLGAAQTQTSLHSGHDGDSRRKLFNYFANELLHKVDERTRNFLLKTAMLPGISVAMAVRLTAESEAGKLLHSLAQRNFFITVHESREQGYHYHPLFREFLLIQTRRLFSEKQLREIQVHAASLLAEAGQTGEAVKLYRAAGEWEILQKLIMTNAPALLAQGRWQTLTAWLAALPEENLARSHWMQYWLGVARFFVAPQESERAFESAFNGFKHSDDTTGMFLAWAGLMEAIIYAFAAFARLDDWVEVLATLLKEHDLPTGDVGARVASAMHMALVIRQPQHPDIDQWAQRVLIDSRTDRRVRGMTLFEEGFHALGTGNRVKLLEARQGLNELMHSFADHPMLAANHYLVEAWIQMQAGDYPQAIQALRTGLEVTGAAGVHLMDGMLLGHCVLCSVNLGNNAAAQQFIEKMALGVDSARPWDQSFYHFVLAWKTFQARQLDEALAHCNTALKLSQQVGVSFSTRWCYFLQAQIKFALGDETDAWALLNQARQIAGATERTPFDFAVLILSAWFALSQGQREAGLDYLARAFALGSKEAYIDYYLWQPEVMSRLCVEALQAGVETKYVQHLIQTRQLVPISPPLQLDNWPWRIKIYTLGRFAILRDGKTLSLSGKGQKKPLDLLKALLAFGGRAVSEEKISEALWPDAEGDAMHRSLATTLHRLRKILESEVLVLKDGSLSLDTRYCWVDIWAFEQVMRDIGRILQAVDIDVAPLQSCTERALQLYHGAFLQKDSEYSWTLSLRERLRSRWLRTIRKLISGFGRCNQCAHAIDLYQRALELDGLSEDLFRGLVGCYAAQGLRADAMVVYQRCQDTLQANLGIAPGAELENLKQMIEQDNSEYINHHCESCRGWESKNM